MPKMKTKSSAKKRFSITGSGKVKYKQAHTAHRLMQKPKSMKRKAKGTTTMARGDAVKVLRSFMPYARKKKSTPYAAATVEGAQ